MKKVAVIGATGYTGVELLRLLVTHPQVKVNHVTSRENAGTRVDAMFPNLRGYLDLDFCAPDAKELAENDLVFFATPHGVAMKGSAELLDAGVKVVDLSADFRVKDIPLWEKWYGMPHTSPQLVEEAVYGLPELFRDEVRNARLVANPGCYPTAVTLGFLPLIENNLVNPDSLIADAKSGISGAGRKASVPYLLAEAGDNFKAYGVSGHRHLPEISQNLTYIAKRQLDLTFTPHLLPIIRGIHATLYADLKGSDVPDLQALYEQRYANEYFVDVMPAGSHPETRSVRSSNMCRIAIHRPQGGKRVVVLSAIDNLVKGAAGQAVQNMNLMLGFDEHLGLTQPALLP